MRGMSATADGFGERTAPVRPLDEEQARLLEILVEAEGKPVSFDELRARGIETPATLVYELEIAGLPIEQSHDPQAGGLCLRLGVELEPSLLDSAAIGGDPGRNRVRGRGGAKPSPALPPDAGRERSEAPRRARRERNSARRAVGPWTVAAAVAGLALAALAIGLSGAFNGASAKDGRGRGTGSLTRRAAAQGSAAGTSAAGSGQARTHPAGARTPSGKGTSQSNANAAGTAGGSELQAVRSQLRQPRRHAGQKRTTGANRPHRAPSAVAAPGGTSAPAPDASHAGKPTRKAPPERKPGGSSGHGSSGAQHNGSEPNRTSGGGGQQTPNASPTPSAQRHEPSPTHSPSGESQASNGGQQAPTGGQEAPSGHTSGQSG